MPLYYREKELFSFNVPGFLWHSELNESENSTTLFLNVKKEDHYVLAVELMRLVELIEDQNE